MDQSQRIANDVRASLINQLEGVESFDDAGIVTWKLSEIGGMTPEEINKMLKVASENRQVYEAGSAVPALEGS